MRYLPLLTAAAVAAIPVTISAQLAPKNVREVPVGKGWARTSVNAVVFRGWSVVTHEDTQYTSYYDEEGFVVLAKRKLGSTAWEVKRTHYKGNVKDAHNSISIAVDGKGVLHIAWDMHGGPLHYAKGTAPGSLELSTQMPMLGQHESSVTYPQFYMLQSGDLLFFYRDGASGKGNMVLNRYDTNAGTWQASHHPLIDGEGKRNGYTNLMAVDSKGGMHLSWVWRESPDVASNHDICYAYSPDEGKTWLNSAGKPYSLPITQATAEVAWPVPQRSELINQTSSAVDGSDRPVIATYWRSQDSKVPQFRVVWFDGQKWQMSEVGARKKGFSLSGGGTKRIPISRPQVVAGAKGEICVIFRDEERGDKISAAISTDAAHRSWQMMDLYGKSVGAWEPSYDPILWARRRQLHIFLQRVGQGDAEKLENIPAQQVSILEWTP